jgi:uncharacterized protein YgfB (UPF0149 family)
MSAPSVEAIFQAKYEEFAAALKDTFPELAAAVDGALALSMAERQARYKAEVLPSGGRPTRPATECPGPVLPGVILTQTIWDSVSESTKATIAQYLTILSFSFVMAEGTDGIDMDSDAFKGWADKFMGEWRNKMNRTDFDSFAKKLTEMFGADGSRLPPFPERLRTGKLAKLAEEIVSELRPEEFGLDPETIQRCEADPSQAFEIIMNMTMRHPEKLQGAMKRIVKRLQEKFQQGSFKPQELVAEAEEMMKEFSENPAFVELMETMRNTFGFEDMDMARAAGQEGSARLALVRSRLRKKLEAKKQGKK